MHIDALISCAYLMAFFIRLKCIDESCSNMIRVPCAFCEVSNAKSSVVFAKNTHFILMEKNLPNSASMQTNSNNFR